MTASVSASPLCLPLFGNFGNYRGASTGGGLHTLPDLWDDVCGSAQARRRFEIRPRIVGFGKIVTGGKYV